MHLMGCACVICGAWQKMGSLEREQMFPLEEEVNNTQDYNSWYAQKKGCRHEGKGASMQGAQSRCGSLWKRASFACKQ